ncbi:MAG: DUF5916 domain-containing protein [Pseudomonadales bacterium]|nr:DUF5916 domain-containing protein [Pseudomonadales bacterium]MDP4765809.1 DUF5916 domain-containing protein [Pseudomonadales bacterium]MDP4875684.1 DUF5916 domain-containing protein [Pseudomonadales bacterium]MDP5058562.1 DUF5916 domain-containing protein [Pseudomonadales bacterium]
MLTNSFRQVAVLFMALGLCCVQPQVHAETIVDLQAGESLTIQRAAPKTAIKIDGHLSDAIWATLPAYDEFLVVEPDTLDRVPHATRVKFFYTDAGLYVGVDMDQPVDSLIGSLSGRDQRQVNRDSIGVTLDTSGEGRYGYWFGVNLGDTLMDGTVLPERQFTSDWDGAWRGASQITDHGWSAELFIPWGTVSMPASGDIRRIGLYMSRKVAYIDERWGWPGLPDTQAKFMSVLQQMQFQGVNPKKQYSIFPFTAVGRDLVEGKNLYKVGADFFWRPSTNMQVSGTVNPDFGNVESDDVVINLDATETFFPEKRLFFLEGQEVFVASPRADTRGNGVGNAGAPYTMVNTRRIGGKPRAPVVGAGLTFPDRELAQPVDLYGAVKLTGQMGSFRYGFLGAFEEDLDLLGQQAGVPVSVAQTGSDYGVARLVYEDSKGGAYRAVGLLTTAVLHDTRDALVQGLDGHYLTADGKLKLDGQVFTSDIDGIDRGYGGFADVEYTIRQGVSQRFGIEYFDDKVDINDLGYLQRNDSFRVRAAHVRTNSGMAWAKNNQFDLRGFAQKNGDGYFTGGGIYLTNRLTFNNLSSVTFISSFTPKAYDDLNSFGNGTYRTEKRRELALRYASASNTSFSFGGGVGLREEALGGNQVKIGGGFTWRPTDRFSADLDISWADRHGWLLHQQDRNFTTFEAEQWTPKLTFEYFLSARQQLRAAMQWVSIRAREDEFYLVPNTPGELLKTPKPAGPSDSFGLSQMSFQVRYRWEIAPLSDLFVVYTRVADKGLALRENSFSDLFEAGWRDPVNDVFVVKVRYRFGS